MFYTFDPQGNTVQRLNSSGTILNSNLYTAQGVPVTTASNTDPYSGFGAQWGYYTDPETGLQLLGHRFYDSGTCRFINRDPIGYSGGINLYNYGADNPVESIDPSGLAADELLPIIRRLIAKGILPRGSDGRYNGDPAMKRRIHEEIGDTKLGNNKVHNPDLGEEEIIEILEGELGSTCNNSGGGWSLTEKIKAATGLTGGTLVIYIIISEGSRLIPVRNLIPVP